MTRFLTLLLVLSSILILHNCYSIGNPIGIGPTGLLFTYNKIATSGKTSNAPKTGQACSYRILDLVAAGEASVAQAASDGGITSIATIDKSNLGVLTIFIRSCTVVTGQ